MIERAVVWDLDGVLADTAEAHFRSWVTALAQWEIPLDRTTFDRVFGMNNRDTLTTLLGRPPEPPEVLAISGRKEYLFRLEAQRTARPMPGALRVLGELEEAGWLQAVASSAPQANIDLLVDKLGIRHRFGAVVSGAELPAGKPDPTLFSMAVRRLGVTPESSVVVEDSPAGVEAARRAGIKCVAVATTRPRAALAEANLVLDDLTEATAEMFSGLLGQGLSG